MVQLRKKAERRACHVRRHPAVPDGLPAVGKGPHDRRGAGGKAGGLSPHHPAGRGRPVRRRGARVHHPGRRRGRGPAARPCAGPGRLHRRGAAPAPDRSAKPAQSGGGAGADQAVRPVPPGAGGLAPGESLPLERRAGGQREVPASEAGRAGAADPELWLRRLLRLHPGAQGAPRPAGV